jgi:hypothetical protein
MWRVAVYARETPGRRGRPRLAQQVARLAIQVASQPGWCHVATTPTSAALLAPAAQG